MKKKLDCKAFEVWAIYDKDDGDIRHIMDPGVPKPRAGYRHLGVCRVRVTPIKPK